MKQACKNRILLLLLTVLAIGWLVPARAAADDEVDGWYEDNGNVFYFVGGEALHDCIAEVEGEYYYFRDDGTLLLEDETCPVSDGEGASFWIRAGWDNVLIADDWYTDYTVDPAESYYYGEGFAAACGPTQVGDELYLFDEDTGVLLCNRKVSIDGVWWESDYRGILVPLQESQESDDTPDGWIWDNDGNTYYYLDGRPLSGGFFNVDGQDRFFHDDGHMAKNESLYLDSHWVRFDESGCVITDSPPENSDSSPNPSVEDEASPEGWQDNSGEKYFYENGSPIKSRWKTILWKSYYFDENGRLLRNGKVKADAEGEEYATDSEGCMVQGGIIEQGGDLYSVDPGTHYIKKNTEVVYRGMLYIADDKGRMYPKDPPAETEADPVAEPQVKQQGAQDNEDTLRPDSDADYTAANTVDAAEEKEQQPAGSIRYSDDYKAQETPVTEDADALPGTDNPVSGILLWRGGDWVEIHGSPENPLEVHIYGRNAAIMDNRSILREAFVCTADGVYGFDQYGNSLAAGFVTRYGKQFCIIAPDPDADMLVLLMS